MRYHNLQLTTDVARKLGHASRIPAARALLFAHAADALERVHAAGRRNAVAECRDALACYNSMYRDQVALVITLARERAPEWSRGELGEPRHACDNEEFEFNRFAGRAMDLHAEGWEPCLTCNACRCVCAREECAPCDA